MRSPLLALLITALLPIAAVAQTDKPTVPAAASASSVAEQEDARFEEAIRNFGFLSGATYQCIPEADRTAHEREVLKAFSGLVRLFGSDRAFFYAAAFGAGTSMSIDRTKCASYVEDFKAAMKSNARGQ